MDLKGLKALLEKRQFLIFFISWLLLCLVLGYAGILQKRPVGIHQWAQCDRGSVARNYAEESMSFFEPRLNASKDGPGITGMEFPFMNYFAAILYKIFGFQEMWYRIAMILVISCGAWYAYLLTKKFVHNQLLGLSMVMLWYVSPVLVYYSPNFVPDTGSLGFMMIAWYRYFRLDKAEGKAWNYFLLFLFVSLSALIKITSLIGPLIMLGVAMIEFLASRPKHAEKKKQLGMLFLITAGAIGLTIAWYFYSVYLNKLYKTHYFLMSPNPIQSFGDALLVIKSIGSMWLHDYYSYFTLTVGVLMFLSCLIMYRHVNRRLMLICLFYLAGIICFFLLMGKQFIQHDYYIITLLPFPFFVLLTFIEMMKRKYAGPGIRSAYRIAVAAVIIIILVLSVAYGRNQLSKRYMWAEIESERLFGMEEYLRSLGLSRQDKVLTIYDCSPSITLYYFNVKGWHICETDGEETILRAYANPEARYIISNDADSFDLNFFLDPYLPFVVTSEGDTIDVSHPAPLKLIGRKNGYSVYAKMGE